MVDILRVKLARLIAPRHYEELDNRVNARVAKIISSMDPFEPLYKKFNGVFSEELEKPEERLDAKSQLLLKTLGYQLRDDPSFIYLMDWIVNTQGNQMLKSPARSDEELGQVLKFGKAQISGVKMLQREVRRLGSLYDEMLSRDKEPPTDPGTAVE